jgi:3-isopropylmalate/(R)-2-methylmalate dehydratase small subunit
MSAADALKIVRVSGRGVTLRGADIDTDRVIPARFLRSVTFDGLEQHVFADDRLHAREQGRAHPLDAPTAAGARILLTHANFGCGSSREHAPQALHRWGIDAIVGESFAEIFAGNALAIGLACVTASRADVDDLMALVDHAPSTIVTVDLASLTVSAGGTTRPIVMPESAQAALMSGEWNGTSLLLRDYEEVERVERGLHYLQRLNHSGR